MNLSHSDTIKSFLCNLSCCGKKVYNNYFLAPLNPEIDILQATETIIFLQPENGFFRLYFCSANLDEFNQLLQDLPTQETICLEWTTDCEIDAKLQAILLQHFSYQTTFQRLRKNLSLPQASHLPINQVDAKMIFEHLQQDFNPLLDHLPSLSQVQQWAEQNTIITIGENNLEAYLIYETKGSSAQMLYMANYNHKTGLLKLWDKIYQAMSFHQFKSVFLWYNLNNPNAKRMYEIEQFVPDRLHTEVYLKVSDL